MSVWQDALAAREGAIDDYLAMLERYSVQAQQEQDVALTKGQIQVAQQALGAKKILASLVADLTRSQKEEQAYARFARNGR